jgi:single-strand DNA-binding protein
MFQRVTLIGNLGQDPEMRYTQTGTAVTNISLATTKRIKKAEDKECPAGWKVSYNGKYYEITTWWRCTAWRQLAETIAQYLKKGSRVYVEGEVHGDANEGNLNPRVWTDRNGNARASFELTVTQVKFLGTAGDGTQQSGVAPVEEPPPGFIQDDDVPF